MKKTFLFSLFPVLFFVIGSFVISAQAAEIIYVEGVVQVQAAQADVWQNAAKGMKVNTGDTLRTARRSRADVALDDAKQNIVRIEPKTLVVLNSNTAGAVDRIDLSRGKVYSNLEGLKAGMGFEVTTPSAVAGVRGSAYSVNVERDEDEVRAFKDDINIKTYDRDKNLLVETTLPEGFKTIIDRFDTPSAFIQVSEREFQRFDRTVEELSDHAAGKEATRAEREARENAEKKQKSEETDGKTSLEQSADQTAEGQDIIEELNDVKDQTKEITTEELRGGGHSEW
jgi:hypothetical protein